MGLLLVRIPWVAVKIIFKRLTTVPGSQYIYLFNKKKKKQSTRTQNVPRNILDIVITTVNGYNKIPDVISRKSGTDYKVVHTLRLHNY